MGSFLNSGPGLGRQAEGMETMLRDYPKTVALRDGREITVRQMLPEDEAELLAFFGRTSPQDRHFLKEDVTDPAVIHNWFANLDYERVIPILAVHDGRIIGDATLHRTRHGWSAHVGEIRIVTDPAYRKCGLGRLLAREIFFLALVLKLRKVTAEMIEDQIDARKVFAALGFEEEAVLHNHVRDLEGQSHHLIVMSQNVADFWQRLEDNIAESMADYSE
jgi:RimJ/RimL family protein N-acetyltransferase